MNEENKLYKKLAEKAVSELKESLNRSYRTYKKSINLQGTTEEVQLTIKKGNFTLDDNGSAIIKLYESTFNEALLAHLLALRKERAISNSVDYFVEAVESQRSLIDGILSYGSEQ